MEYEAIENVKSIIIDQFNPIRLLLLYLQYVFIYFKFYFCGIGQDEMFLIFFFIF